MPAADRRRRRREENAMSAPAEHETSSPAASRERPPIVRSVAVLGAGTMGAQIAAHFANAGVPALLLDVTADAAKAGLERARRLKPDPFFTPDAARLITTGAIDADSPQLAGVDWIVEAIVERLDVKRDLLARVDAARRPGSLVTSNTSGLSLSALADGRSADFRRHWLGTHFFNPPRYLRLLELVPTPDTDPAIVSAVARFADQRLGKGTVVAKDTPNFIANHIGLFAMLRILEVLEHGAYTIEEIDAITGPALGRPKSGTFRTMDVVGLDVLAHVVGNLFDRVPESDRPLFQLTPTLERLVARGWIGEKSGSGFYKRERGPGSESRILSLDPASMTYRARQSARLPALDAARPIEDVRERVRVLFGGQDTVGDFLRRTLAPTLVYTARVTPSIAHSIDDVDRVMQWGFGWELGPFELFDAIGVREVVAACDAVSGGRCDVPPLVDEVLASGRNAFRHESRVPRAGAGLQLLRDARDRSRVVRSNPGASLVDIGDGVLCVEFHSKMNAIGGDTIAMMAAGVAEAERNFAALVVGNEGVNFSAGANLMLLLLEAQEGNWDEIDLMVRSFQRATTQLRYAQVPVVVAPAGLTLGGGCEVLLHAEHVQAAAEAYIGLVEVGVGLIPAGAGTKEMLARAAEAAGPTADLLPFVQRVFEVIGFGRTSTSAAEAQQIGYLRPSDGITMNRDRLIADARTRAAALARAGYRPPLPRTAVRVGGEPLSAALKLGVHLAWRAGRISDHDALIGRALAHVLAGGAVPHETTVSEQHLLDLEREAFLRLCGEQKTLARIQHTLKTGKPLRN
jgi:3-hydroxyacyl-CoA dehydrogenase